ncbi:MAG: selenium-dependent molybdenum cofactor biosynthesis protein YqeB [Ilumatobacteraceae bacterium]
MNGLCVVRGGGDLATGVVWRLRRIGVPVVVTELAHPRAIRRTVALSTAVDNGSVVVEGLEAVHAVTTDDIAGIVAAGRIPVVVDPDLTQVRAASPISTVVDARLAKHVGDTSIDMADLVVALGPGFTAGRDCHAVIETQRGHRLGRVIWQGSAIENTGRPAPIGGHGEDRVLRAAIEGTVSWSCAIGDVVSSGTELGVISSADQIHPIIAPFTGVVRGAIADGFRVSTGLKIADIDPRCEPSACWEISDKALAIGGGVVEAVMARRAP